MLADDVTGSNVLQSLGACLMKAVVVRVPRASGQQPASSSIGSSAVPVEKRCRGARRASCRLEALAQGHICAD